MLKLNSLVENDSSVELTPDTLTLDFVKQYLRIDHDFDDVEIMVAIKSAISYVRKYVKQPTGEPLDDDLIIPILTLVAHFYENKTPMGKANEKVDSIINTILEMNRNDIL